MLPDLTGTDLDDYIETLHASHEMRVRLEVWDANDVLVQRLGDDELALVEGQVDVDDQNPIKRQLSMTLANTVDTLMDPTNPGAAVHPQNQVRVIYSVYVHFRDGTTDWVEVPVFHGPVTRVERGESTVSVEAQSKETLLLPPNRLNRSVLPEDAGRVQTFYAGDLIKAIAKRHGETLLRVPRTNRKLPEDAKLFDQASQSDGAWSLMQKLTPAGMQLFYAADGWLTMRPRRARQPVYVFNDGPGGEVLSKPLVEYDMTVFRNTLELHAFEKKTPKQDANPALRVTVRLPQQHPLSPASLARNGHPRELLKVVKSKHVYADATRAKQDATTMLLREASSALDVKFDTLPVPFLEPGDLVAVDVKGLGRYAFQLRAFSLPLTPASMSLGYTRRIR
jgi:hypothetical protein